MTTKLLLKSRSSDRTSTLTAFYSNGKSACEVAQHPSLKPGAYVFENVVEIHESHQGVRTLIGPRVMVFRRHDRNGKLYLYAGSEDLVPVQDGVAVAYGAFVALIADLVPNETTLQVRARLFKWGGRKLRGDAIPNQFRHVFRTPLERFARAAEGLSLQEEDARTLPDRGAAGGSRVRTSTPAQGAIAGNPRSTRTPRATATVRSRTPSPSTVGTRVRSHDGDDGDSLGDFVFMSMFPEVAPLYRPNSFLAWYLAYEHLSDGARQGIVGSDGTFEGAGASGDWQDPVPGFPEAASQKISEHRDCRMVELFDDMGAKIGSFTVSDKDGKVRFSAPGGHDFTVSDRTNPTIEYASEAGQRFSWDGMNDPLVESTTPNESSAAGAAFAAERFFESAAGAAEPHDVASTTSHDEDEQRLGATTSY